MNHELRLIGGAPVSDDPFFYDVGIDSGESSYTWAEVFLENVDEASSGPARVESAGVVVRMWFDKTYFDVPYPEVIAALERARSLLLTGESQVPPEAP